MRKTKVKTGKGGTKATLYPKKGFLGFFKPKTFFQKEITFSNWDRPFRPSDYWGNSEERRKLAYQDAKQHAQFYRDLVREGVYPQNTKVNVKRKRHSDEYTVELWMPKILPLEKDLFSGFKEGEIGSMVERVRRVANKYGHQAGKVSEDLVVREGPWQQGYNPPDQHLRNYGLDEKGKVKYLDADVLRTKIPFKGRKDDELIGMERRRREKDTSMKRIGIEQKVLTISTSLSLVLSLFFLSPNLTGNAIGTFNQNATNHLGIALFIVFILLGFLKIRKF